MSKDDRWDNFEKFSSRKDRGFAEDRKEKKKERKIKIRKDRRNRDRARDGWEQ